MPYFSSLKLILAPKYFGHPYDPEYCTVLIPLPVPRTINKDSEMSIRIVCVQSKKLNKFIRPNCFPFYYIPCNILISDNDVHCESFNLVTSSIIDIGSLRTIDYDLPCKAHLYFEIELHCISSFPVSYFPRS